MRQREREREREEERKNPNVLDENTTKWQLKEEINLIEIIFSVSAHTYVYIMI